MLLLAHYAEANPGKGVAGVEDEFSTTALSKDTPTPLSSTSGPSPSSPSSPPASDQGGSQRLANGTQTQAGNETAGKIENAVAGQVAADERKRKEAEAARKKAQELALKEQERRRAGRNNQPADIKRLEDRLNDLNASDDFLKKLKNGEKLKVADAERALDSEVRKRLLAAVENEQIQEKLKKEEIDLTKTLSQLAQMAALTAQRSQGMATAVSGGRNPTSSPLATNIQPSQVGEAASKSKDAGGISTSAYEAELTTRLEAALAKAEADEKTAGRPTLTAQQKAQLREKLGNSLRSQLTAYYKAKAAEAALSTASAYAPEGQLKREQVSAPAAEEAAAEQSHGMGDVIGSTFSAFQDQHLQGGFAMQTSETEAAVNGLLEESSRDLASDSAAGLLGEDSPALFIRVSEAYRRHEKRFVTH